MLALLADENFHGAIVRGLRRRHVMPFAQAIDDILLVAECSREGEWEGQVLHLPV